MGLNITPRLKNSYFGLRY